MGNITAKEVPKNFDELPYQARKDFYLSQCHMDRQLSLDAWRWTVTYACTGFVLIPFVAMSKRLFPYRRWPPFLLGGLGCFQDESYVKSICEKYAEYELHQRYNQQYEQQQLQEMPTQTPNVSSQ